MCNPSFSVERNPRRLEIRQHALAHVRLKPKKRHLFPPTVAPSVDGYAPTDFFVDGSVVRKVEIESPLGAIVADVF